MRNGREGYWPWASTHANATGIYIFIYIVSPNTLSKYISLTLLASLKLRGNRIGVTGGRAIARGLARTQSLG